MKKTLILGGPGAGKTHTLLGVVEKELADGVKPHDVAFVSFTRKAVGEARDRAKKRFCLTDSELPYFRTLHSLCFRQLGLRSDETLGPSHKKELGDILGVPITGRILKDEDDATMLGDRMMFLDGLARSTLRDLEFVWGEVGEGIPWLQQKQFSVTLRSFKDERGLFDFTDMIEDFIEEGKHVDVKVAIVDEAQDLTPLQWRAVDLAFGKCERLYFAGDDDQAIYEWSGADVPRFTSLNVDDKTILPMSYRIPKSVFKLATKIIENVSTRYNKDWGPRDAPGNVDFCSGPADVDLTQGSWYLLARNKCFLKRLEEACMEQGVVYGTRWGSAIKTKDVQAIKLYEAARGGAAMSRAEMELVADALGIDPPDGNGAYVLRDLVKSRTPGIWHEEFRGMPSERVAYYVSVRRRGAKLLAKPQVLVDTIHGVKGGEADNVLILPDQTARTERGAARNPDAEHRVFYTGVTRARERLYIAASDTNRYYKVNGSRSLE